MTNRIVVAVFESLGEAENASHRLLSEGVAEIDISVRLLRLKGPVPQTMEPELATIRIDPFFWFLGSLTDAYLQEISNGETAVSVETRDQHESDVAESVLRMFKPKRVDIVTPPPTATRADGGLPI